MPPTPTSVPSARVRSACFYLYDDHYYCYHVYVSLLYRRAHAPLPGEDLVLPDRPLTPSGIQVADREAGAEDDTRDGHQRASSSTSSGVAVRKVGADGRPMTMWGTGAGGSGQIPAPASSSSSSSSLRAGPSVKGSQMCLYALSHNFKPETRGHLCH